MNNVYDGVKDSIVRTYETMFVCDSKQAHRRTHSIHYKLARLYKFVTNKLICCDRLIGNIVMANQLPGHAK
ncbi:hypothetical protein ASF16_15745 [Acidovorax sp. Leaf78]|nr:hypothetical protein ASF16_15745 [Acidovorax sp. Leaf78]